MGTSPCARPAVPSLTVGRNFRFGIWWPMRSPLSLGVCQKAVGGGISGFLPAPSNPTGSDFPLVRLRSAPAFRLASSPHMQAPGLRQGLLRLTLEFGPLLGPLPPPHRPGSWGAGRGGGAPSETGDSRAQPWLWATRLRCRPCVCSGPRVWTSHRAGEEQWDYCCSAESSVPVLVSPSTRECGGCQP